MFNLELKKLPADGNEPQRISVKGINIKGSKQVDTELGILYCDGCFQPYTETITELRPEVMKQICIIAENFNLFYNNIKN